MRRWEENWPLWEGEKGAGPREYRVPGEYCRNSGAKLMLSESRQGFYLSWAQSKCKRGLATPIRPPTPKLSGNRNLDKVALVSFLSRDIHYCYH
jgi:hypothetical protein